MESSTFLLVIAAATIHALWNFATKKVSGDLGIIAIGLCAASLVSLPFAFYYSISVGVPSDSIFYIVATGIVHALYFYCIGKCYEAGDISTIYPMARGIGVAGTALVAAYILGERISMQGCAGILIVCMGILGIAFDKFRAYACHGQVPKYTLAVGITIIAYSCLDKVGSSHVHPVVYISGMFSIAAVLVTASVLLFHRDKVIIALRTQVKYGVAIGTGSISTYLMILFAFRHGNVSYIAAIREFSVALASAMGYLLLKERMTLSKVLGIAAIIIGLVLIRSA